MASSKPSPIVFGDLHDGAFFAHASQPATRPPHGQRADATASCSVRGVDANVGDDEINEGEQPWRRGIDAATHALCVPLHSSEAEALWWPGLASPYVSRPLPLA